MNNTNPADWTDAEIARWMSERDGWRNMYVKDDGEQILMGYHDKCADMFGSYAAEVPNYPHSLDAAAGWLGRMGILWEKRAKNLVFNEYVLAFFETPEQWRGIESVITPTCPTSRALCNAGAAAWLAREVRHA